MVRALLGIVLLVSICGCGSGYVMTVPDVVSPPGSQLPAVVMLEWSELMGFSKPVKGAACRFSVDDGPLRGAYTDNLGYAAVALNAPASQGVYTLNVQHMDADGDEVSAESGLFVWNPESMVVAVDLDSISPHNASARDALTELAQQANIIYFTRDPQWHTGGARKRIEDENLPVGPVLMWKRRLWRLGSHDRLNTPKLIIDEGMVSPLAILREMFANFASGVTNSQSSVNAYMQAGIKPIVIDAQRVKGDVIHCSGWDELNAGCLVDTK